MNFLENKIKELSEYLPPLTKRMDFEDFWEETIQIAKSVDLRPEFMEYDYPSNQVKVYSISYNGFDDTRIYGWYIIPVFLKKEKYPCLINYHGYTGSRGVPADFMAWAMMGLAVISIDCRGQGGVTGNKATYSSGITDNLTNKGILDKYEYYYRHVYMDCLKAIDFAEACPEVDKDRIIINGVSQGGALGMAVSCLDHRHKIALVDVPSNSNIERRVEGCHGSFTGVKDYLTRYPEHLEKAYETLSYFDTMNMADKITCKIFASVALKDEVCPAVCYFASYNRITAPKQIEVYPFNGHDGAYPVQFEKKLRYLKESGIL
jgi:cephalosporin-C deacetylase